MEPLKNIADRYWIIYYLVYVAGVDFGVWRYRPLQETGKDELLVLVAIFALAAGVALLVAILLEVFGRMVLLIPAAWKKIKEQGIKQGVKEERQRILDEVSQLGDQVPPEILKIVRAEADNRN
jgi:hypothetical protein